MEGADEDLIGAAIAERFAGSVDAAREGRLRDYSAIPYRVEDLVLTDDALAVPDEECQQVENLGLDVNELARPAQLLASKIEFVISENQPHPRLRLASRSIVAGHSAKRAERRKQPGGSDLAATSPVGDAVAAPKENSCPGATRDLP